MKKFYVTSTASHAEAVMREILRLDPIALISHRRENKTLLLVASEALSEWTLEAIDGVGHAVNITKMAEFLRKAQAVEV